MNCYFKASSLIASQISCLKSECESLKKLIIKLHFQSKTEHACPIFKKGCTHTKYLYKNQYKSECD